MRYATQCSGIEAPSAAWHPLGWKPVFFSEIDPFPCAVLAHHYPHVPNLGDMTRFKDWPDATFDVSCGGTPCQSFSVAGLRKGLDDPRGNLMLTYLAIAARFRPRWLVWENVPGVLSSGGGRDFGTFLGGLGQLGYGFAYRILDAQHFGVPQRRRRVFVVGCLGDWRAAAAVLFERHSLQGHPAPRRETGKGFAAATARSVAIRGRDGTPQAELGDDKANAILTPNGGRGGIGVGAVLAPELAHSVRAQAQASHREDSDTYVAHSLRADGFDASEDGTGRGTPLVVADTVRSHPRPGSNSVGAIAFYPTNRQPDFGNYEEVSPAVKVGSGGQSGNPPAIAFRSDAGRNGSARTPSADAEGRVRLRDPGFNVYEETAPTLDASAPHGVSYAMQVRRLTPRECERLQGFPDNYTQVAYRGKPAADGPRYKALGNSMAVPVVRWIGERIALVDVLTAERAA